MNTIAARIVYSIMTQNDILATLTFHGGDNAIGYPWGSWNHSYQPGGNSWDGNTAPDYNAFLKFGL